jgi:hypothetical protein
LEKSWKAKSREQSSGEAEKQRSIKAEKQKSKEAGKQKSKKKNGKKIIPEKKNNPPLKIIEGMQQCKALQEEPLIGRIADAIRGKKQTLLRNGSSSGPIKWPSSTCGLDGPCS